jgi:hypothetical protein
MSFSPTSHSPGDDPLGYESIGYASIEFVSDNDGVLLVANADGLRSLARLFTEMANRSAPTGHIHLTPAMQLSPTSACFVAYRDDGGRLPDGSLPPTLGHA